MDFIPFIITTALAALGVYYAYQQAKISKEAAEKKKESQAEKQKTVVIVSPDEGSTLIDSDGIEIISKTKRVAKNEVAFSDEEYTQLYVDLEKAVSPNDIYKLTERKLRDK